MIGTHFAFKLNKHGSRSDERASVIRERKDGAHLYSTGLLFFCDIVKFCVT